MRKIAGPGASIPLDDASILVEKADHRLSLYSGERLIKSYRVALGGSPSGKKYISGDRRTPEGSYYICTRLQRTQYHLFMGLNYPNSEDATEALGTSSIAEKTSNSILEAERLRKQPPWNTSMGGAIGIHGGGTYRDWTWGCVAVEDSDIEEIWAATRYWTPVEIRP